MHALTIDLEEWFCSHNLESNIDYKNWEFYESRIDFQTDLILKILSKKNVKATFFILGWVAEKYPHLIRAIMSEGHEIGSHGYSHKLTWNHTAASFRKDLTSSLKILKDITKNSVQLFRAPAFSLTPKTKWILPILKENNILVDSSVYPTSLHPEYGFPDINSNPFYWENKIYEIPMSCVKFLNLNIPVSGGAYFRFIDFRFYKSLVKTIEKQSGILNFYIHPWELDRDIPKLHSLKLQRKIRHYYGLNSTLKKFEKLISEFEFGRLTNAFSIPINDFPCDTKTNKVY